MGRKNNQTATDIVADVLMRLPGLISEWSVQGSNLRPPVNVGKWSDDERYRSLFVTRGLSRHVARRMGERADSKDNQRAIRP